MKYIDILTFSDTLNKINDSFNSLTDKFTSNDLVASFITVGVFIIFSFIISKNANKWLSLVFILKKLYNTREMRLKWKI